MPDTRPFSVERGSDPRGQVVRLRGEATVDQVERLRSSLRAVCEGKPRRVVLDLAELTFINSDGLGALLEFRRDLVRSGAVLRLAGANPDIAEMFKKTRLVEVFPMYQTADAAMGAT